TNLAAGLDGLLQPEAIPTGIAGCTGQGSGGSGPPPRAGRRRGRRHTLLHARRSADTRGALNAARIPRDAMIFFRFAGLSFSLLQDCLCAPLPDTACGKKSVWPAELR